jgi:hypothetical protein
MNPGKVVDPYRLDQNLTRRGPGLTTGLTKRLLAEEFARIQAQRGTAG